MQETIQKRWVRSLRIRIVLSVAFLLLKQGALRLKE